MNSNENLEVKSAAAHENHSHDSELRVNNLIAWSSLIGSVAIGGEIYVLGRQPILSALAAGVSYAGSMAAMHALKRADQTLENN